jgi:hypothetical protein
MAGAAVHDGFDPFDIGLPSFVRASVRVGQLDAKGHAFSANVTFCHYRTSLLIKITAKKEPH